MLQLLKAEFQYYKSSSIFYLAVFLIVDFAFIGWGSDVIEKSYPGIRAAMVLIMFGLLLMRQIKIQQEKTDRFYMILPISLNRISLLRIMFLTVFWIILFSLFWINNLIFSFNYLIGFLFWDLISLSGIVFAAISIPLLHRDLNITFQGKNQKLIIGSIYGLIIVLGYIFLMLFFIVSDSTEALNGFVQFRRIAHIMTSAGVGPLLILSAGSALLYLSMVIFQKRKTYLD
ncbi:MAG: hypothetical protein D8M58_04165 [Calditrichaeota bacterium]|nr:MAG: hypothetical protein DWQ03_02910 [Calditrichota bacterium]MBL1204564.1 hypothetical protein [Calditrichota bacterium]NOG44393.1 hypothetical protein [Calditrichota bacterium]